MSKTVYVHIGSDKAGSSSLQFFLFRNRELLRELGCHLLETQLRTMAGHPFLFQDLESGDWAAAVEEIRNAPGHIQSFILTWEGIHFFNPDQIARLHQHLGEFDVKFVYYIREQAPLIQSGILQRLKEATLSGVNLCEVGRDNPNVINENRDYEQVIARFERLFGADCMILRIFEPQELIDGDIKTDFLRMIGLDKTEEFADPDDLNPSLTVEAGIAVQMFDRLVADHMEKIYLRDAFLRLSTKRKGSKYFLAKGAVNHIREHFAPSNRAVAQRFFGKDELFRIKPADNPQRYDRDVLNAYIADYLKIWPAFPTVKPNADLSVFEDQAGEAKDHWKIEDRVAYPTVNKPRLRFRTQLKFMLPTHNSVSLKLRAPGAHMFTAVVSHKGERIGHLRAYEKLHLPLASIEPYDCFDLELEPATPEDEIRLIGVSWAFEERMPD